MTAAAAFGSKQTLSTDSGDVSYYSLDALEHEGIASLDRIPVTVKVLLENLLRSPRIGDTPEDDVAALAAWGRQQLEDREFPYSPSRVVLQDFTGVPAVVDLAAMRSAIDRRGGDPARVDPLVPVDLVIDHSVQVDAFASRSAFGINVEREYERNGERYQLLKWAQNAFGAFRVVPPGMGIVHQVNLEHLATVVRTMESDGDTIAIPDTLVGTDSHTTMINGLGVLGWGVGGIEAEAAMLGQAMPLLTPRVVGFRMSGEMPAGVTATDLVLTVTEMLREHGVVGKFVEFYGTGLSSLPVADRATISNMCPEYGATAALFPIDERTLEYLALTGRPQDLIHLVETYARAQGLFRTDDAPDPTFTERLELDLCTVESSVAGPRRPQDRVPLRKAWGSFNDVYGHVTQDASSIEIDVDGERVALGHGSIVIAAITSCTNTSNPSVMLGAGLLARKAVERGLRSKPWVKTSMAPGSRVVTKYLDEAGLNPYLEKLGFHVVGYGCTTCIGNSGPLPDPVADAIDAEDLAVVSVLSGNRNFEGRIHPQVKASYLASPPLVVAYALAGTLDIDLTAEALGEDESGTPVYLHDLWPSAEEIHAALSSVRPEFFTEEYARVFDGEENWKQLPSPTGTLFEWDPDSTYVREPPFFMDIGRKPPAVDDIDGARVLAMLGDSVTTDHVSPAGAIPPASPAGRYLIEQGVQPRAFNSYGSRRGNHEVMMRGTFGSIRLRNRLVEPKEGSWTLLLPDEQETTIYDASVAYRDRGVPSIVIAGREYGSGSSRDWAAKGPNLLGVRAVIAESFERIHRSNLVGMGVLPLQFLAGESAETLGLSGRETYRITGIRETLRPHAPMAVSASRDDGSTVHFTVECRIDSNVELDYYRHGGVLHTVLRRMLAGS